MLPINLVSSEAIKRLTESQCSLVILWSQSGDVRSIAAEADRQGLSASDPRHPILWIVSETIVGSFEDVCAGQLEICERVFRGSLAFTPNFGPGSPSYARFSRAWHAQRKEYEERAASSSSSPFGPLCDPQRDKYGDYVWVRNHDRDFDTIPICAQVNFSDYSRDEASSLVPETTGDGRVSTYVPYAYDATVAAAFGLHNLFTDVTGDWPTKDQENSVTQCRSSTSVGSSKTSTCGGDPKTEAMRGENIYKHMLRGKVSRVQWGGQLSMQRHHRHRLPWRAPASIPGRPSGERHGIPGVEL